ncbi:Asp-tRNA(Asn)/Glu-tRNA(Gln) amidotransferase subunit GatC [Clostridium aciditolerans]|uniref:Aspartyl/glutamyl-tRNA(Asn/Gln) amidotransferase subunit C n=1 Tax=Clostridium aciditolerans TaxID=339861 RepID=A0A934HYB6_9CLOT|nr:Asp-tRNA(Asn)/Glu-tRNA(Gln) amidotransferase subunit GatC [Clostridium aciditolerans]MBI6872620.1 Asp-tRNA(Asn)/Glu-tRNA(Gln) amidotransferase subunit GatC [Clostridium aciditolerans]
MISIDEVKYIAKLSKLKFTEEEAEKMAAEFGAILGHFEYIDKFDLSDIDIHPKREGLRSVIRKDEEKVFEDKEKLFQNVKTKRETYIEVPKIIE